MSAGDRVAQVLGPTFDPKRYEYAVFRNDKVARKKHDGWEVVQEYDAETTVVRRKRTKGGILRAAQ